VFRIFSVLVLVGTFSTSAQAATTSYLLDEINGGTESPPYLQVNLFDTSGGQVNFIVDLVNELICGGTFTCNNYGIQEFGFNIGLLAPDDQPTVSDIINLPTNWSATIISGGSQMDGFGMFDILLSGPGPNLGNNRQNPRLTFSIAALGSNNIWSYIGTNDNGSQSAAQVSGDGPGNAFYSDSGPGLIATPVPAAFWLFGTALIGFVGMSRRTKI
jgi:hypothetical protein